MKTIYNGIMELENEVNVTDPSYDVGIWCSHLLVNVKPGKYVATSTIRDTIDEWGERVVAIQLNHIDYPDVVVNDLTGAIIGVDSGQCGFFDLASYEKNHDNETWYNDSVGGITSHIHDLADPNSLYPVGLIGKKGFVAASGFGDGVYKLYTKTNTDGEVIAMKVVFIDEY